MYFIIRMYYILPLEILEELQGKYLPSNKQKIADFYEACMDKCMQSFFHIYIKFRYIISFQLNL